MILVVNLNASIDKRYVLADLKKGAVMRAAAVQNTPGGKGVHVANVLTQLGQECMVTGMLGGKSGEFIAEKLHAYGISHDFVSIAGETRSCIAMITQDGVQTELLEPGPAVSEAEQERFLAKFQNLLVKADLVVCSGSLPQNVPDDFYRRLIHLAGEQGKKALLDTSGKPLQEAIKAKPFFIKPNRDEIEALTKRRLETETDFIQEIERFWQMGVQMAAISLGARGAMAGYQGRIYQVVVPDIQAVNPVGSGDAFVAGMALAIGRGCEPMEALRWAAACGTANALEAESGSVTPAVVEELREKINVKILR